jgi:hypothetical protein
MCCSFCIHYLCLNRKVRGRPSRLFVIAPLEVSGVLCSPVCRRCVFLRDAHLPAQRHPTGNQPREERARDPPRQIHHLHVRIQVLFHSLSAEFQVFKDGWFQRITFANRLTFKQANVPLLMCERISVKNWSNVNVVKSAVDDGRVPRELEKRVRSWVRFQFLEESAENKVKKLRIHGSKPITADICRQRDTRRSPHRNQARN